jgi:hypothetical protein
MSVTTLPTMRASSRPPIAPETMPITPIVAPSRRTRARRWPGGFARNPEGAEVLDHDRDVPRFPATMQPLGAGDILVPWLAVEYEIGRTHNGVLLSLNLSNPFDARTSVVSYREPPMAGGTRHEPPTPSEFRPTQNNYFVLQRPFVIKSRLCSRVSASIRRLDEHGPMHRHARPGGAERMNAGLVCGQQAQGRLRGEAR